MYNNKLVGIIITAVIVLVFFFLPFAEDNAKKQEPTEDASQAAQEEAPEPVFNAGAKKEEEYTPELYYPTEIVGAGYSDDTWAVLFGRCSIGATVTADDGTNKYTVKSEGGTFALRFNAPLPFARLLITQSSKGKDIGEPYYWEGTVVKSASSTDPNEATFAGYDNQCFYYKMLGDYERLDVLSEEDARAMKDKYSWITNELASVGNGCELITLFAPSPATVFPELVPEKFPPGSGPSKLEQMQEILAEAGAHVIDLEKVFLERKNDALKLYHRYDTHWTDYAGYLAYVELYKYISEKYPAAAPRSFNDFYWQNGYFSGMDIPYYFGVSSSDVYEYSVLRSFAFEAPGDIAGFARFSYEGGIGYGAYTQGVIGQNAFVTYNSSLPNIYVIRNSYSGQMMDIMAERSNVSVFAPMFSYDINIDEIRQLSPDYVIILVSEWDLYNLQA